jgi:acyl carrier protein
MVAEFSSDLAARACAELEILAGDIMFGEAEQENIDVRESLVNLGFDSFAFLELLEKIDQRFSLQVNVLQLSDFPSLAELANYLVDKHADAVAATIP